MPRTFDDKPATRASTPLLVGLIGPSGSGKTYSALRLATGFQRVNGGEIFVIDTEACRALHYAPEKGEPIGPGKFRFRHVPFGSPFSPADYEAAVTHCLRKGARNIIIDSMSHEHEGRGGVLEAHDTIAKQLAARYNRSVDAMSMSAWNLAKKPRRHLLDAMIQAPANFILCFRAKQKLRIKRDEDPVPLGFMPIAGEEYVYEMTLKCLLLPGADGVPSWHSDDLEEGEKLMVKLPRQFREMFAKPRQLDEATGEELARWAAGKEAAAVPAAELVASYQACSEPANYRALEELRRANWASYLKPDKAALKEAADDAARRIADAPTEAPPDGEGELEGEGDEQQGDAHEGDGEPVAEQHG